VLKQHVRIGEETSASAEQVGDCTLLLGERVDDGGARHDQRSLEHVRQDREDRLERNEARDVISLVSDTSHELGKNNEINDQRRSEKRVLAGVVHNDSVETVHEDGGRVLIHSTLGVTDVRDVLDDNDVVRVFTWLVEDVVHADHVINDVGLGNLLGSELSRSRQVLTIVVTEVVVRNDSLGLDTSRNKEVNQDGLHLSLTRLEVITTDEDTAALSEVNDTWNNGILRRAIDVRAAFEDSSNSEDVGGRDFRVRASNGCEDLISGHVETLADISETLSVSSPEDNNLVELVVCLELADVSTDVVKVLLLGALGDEVISTILLVSSNEVGVVDGGKRNHGLHVGAELLLELVVKDLSTSHSVCEVHLRDIPTTDDEIVGVNHGENTVERNVNLLAGSIVGTNADGSSLSERTEVVRLLDTVLGGPSDLVLVGQDTTNDGSTVVTTETNQHDTNTGDCALGLEDVAVVLRLDLDNAIGEDLNMVASILVVRDDLLLSVAHVGRVNGENRVGTEHAVVTDAARLEVVDGNVHAVEVVGANATLLRHGVILKDIPT